MLSIKDLKNLSLEEVIQEIKKNNIAEPTVLTYSLDTAANNKQVPIMGNFIGIIAASDMNTNVQIRFNRIDGNAITFSQGLYIIRPYDQIFLTWSAQANKTISIICTPLAPELFQILDNRSEQLQTSYLASIAARVSGSDSLVLYTLLSSLLRSLSGDTGTQINKYNSAENETKILHTVTAGKNLFLSAVSMNTYVDGTLGANQACYLFVRNGSDTLVYTLTQQNFANGLGIGTHPAGPRQFIPPIKIPAEYDVCLLSTALHVATVGCISGWEEAA
jgi:hypothetical protein